jgi:SAM-dependent methyltransferase
MGATSAVHVDPTNQEQLRAWDGGEGAYWATHAEHFDRSVAPFHEELLQAARIGVDEHVLDVGCGTGQVTRDAGRLASAGSALGVDLSAAMLQVARRDAERDGLRNVRFEQGDAQVHPFDAAAFDLVVGRTSAMFFGDKPAAFRNLARALRPGGRLVIVTWQPLSETAWIRELSGALSAGQERPAPPPDGAHPFSRADPDRLRSLLLESGFTDISVACTQAPMWFGEDAEDAFQFVFGLLGWMVDGLDDAARGRAMDALRATIASHETTDGVRYGAAAWTTRAVRS